MKKKYNILAIAYAFEPHKGSEPEVGWKTILELGKNNRVFVITRQNNKINIENEVKNNKKIFENIEIIYYDLPKIFILIKKYIKFNQIYYFIWQIAIARKIKSICKKYSIDVCHHITFATIKVFSAGAFSGVPFIFGPVGGAERTNYKFYKNITKRCILKETIRDIDIKISKYNPLNLYTLKRADKILVTTSETNNFVPKKYRNKCEIMQTIAVDNIVYRKSKEFNGVLNLLYVGNLLHWKGTNIIVDTLNSLNKLDVNFKMHIIGDGEQKSFMKAQLKKYKIDDKVKFLGKLPRINVLEKYEQSDLLFFPSLHDSGGMVVLEAMSKGTPTICLNNGGPAVNIKNNVNGIIVEGTSYDEVIKNLAFEIKILSEDREKLKRLSEACLVNLNQYTWKNKINKIINIYNNIN